MMYFIVTVFVVVSASPALTATENFTTAFQELSDLNVLILDELNNDGFVPYSGDEDRLDWSLIKRVASSFEGNFLFSPLGLRLTLSLLKEAAVSETLTEVSAIFSDDLNRTDHRMILKNITELLRKKSPENIAFLSSWIFISSDFEKRRRFEAIGETFYNTDITGVNTQSPAETVKAINSVVSNVTVGNILNPVHIDDVEDLRTLALNTLYFKGNWRHQFSRKRTRLSSFYVSPTTLKNVPVMKVTDKFYYTESMKFDAKILRMSFEGNRFAMYFIVPNSLTGLSDVMENIRLLPAELQFLKNEVVDVTLPKFMSSYTLYLENTLKEMGIRVAFEESASFPGIARGQLISKRIKLSKVMQRILIDVHEHGVGSPANGISEASILNIDTGRIKEVEATRPFFFFIQEEVTRQMLVFGRVADPTS